MTTRESTQFMTKTGPLSRLTGRLLPPRHTHPGLCYAKPAMPDPPYSQVEALLRKVPQEFNFFQTVRLLERINPDGAPVGTFAPAAREVARFQSNPELAFPASRIQNVDWTDSTQPAIIINFMGLTGPMGVLPLYYSQLVAERKRAKDHGIRTFLDLFNHRMISLFYAAWEKYRFTVAYERQERDRFSHHLLDLIGLGTPGLEDRQSVRDDSLIYYCGLLALHPRSAAGLRYILSDYFDIAVEVEQFVGGWYQLDRETQCLFDKGNTYSEQLGVGAIIGDEIWDQQSAVRLRFGPMPLARYLDFLPNGTAYSPLKALTRFYSGGEIDFEVQLVLQRDQVPGCELGSESDSAPQLAWTTWSLTKSATTDADDTILRI
jgi:type VI secretion system protein ImpH